MALRQVGKGQVYIVDVQVPTPKTSNGQSYATLYSNLRWKIWEELQKAEEKKLDIEVRTFEQKQKYYEDKRKQLENQILKLKEIKLRKDSGEISGSDAYRLARDTANLELKVQLANAGKSTTKKEPIIDVYGISGEPGKITGTAETTYRTSGAGIEAPIIDVSAARAKLGEFETPEARQSAISKLKEEKAALDKSFTSKKNRTEEEAKAYLEAQTSLNNQIYNLETYKAPVEGEAKKEDVVVDFDTEIANLEKKLAGLAPPDMNIDTDLMNRTRERFAGAAGVGTFYGLDPRRDKVLPYFDSAKAVSQIKDVTEKSDAAALSQARLDKKKKVADAKSALDLINSGVVAERPGQKVELEKIILSGEGLTGDEEVAVVKASREAMLAEGGAFANPRILPEGEFLSRDNFPVYKGPKPEEKTVDKALILSEKESEAAKVAETLGREIPPPTALAPSISKLRGMGANLFAVKPSVINPKLPVSLDDMTPDTSSVDFVAPSRLQAPVAPERSMQAPARIDENFYNSLFGPYKTSVDIGKKTYGEVPNYQYEAPIRETVLRSGPSPLITQPPIPVPAQLAPNELAVPPVDIRIPTDKNAPLRKPLDTKGIDEELKLDQGKAPTRETRAADYAMRIINKGKDLAQKEKKLARIARKDESGKAVAKNIDIVDKLYEANKGRQDRFKATFDEITRTMDGKLREEAHAYLVAKDIIEGDKSKPV
jgi:hypothetical protein